MRSVGFPTRLPDMATQRSGFGKVSPLFPAHDQAQLCLRMGIHTRVRRYLKCTARGPNGDIFHDKRVRKRPRLSLDRPYFTDENTQFAQHYEGPKPSLGKWLIRSL